MTRVVHLSDAIARRRRVLRRRVARLFSMTWLARIEALIECRRRAREVA